MQFFSAKITTYYEVDTYTNLSDHFNTFLTSVVGSETTDPEYVYFKNTKDNFFLLLKSKNFKETRILTDAQLITFKDLINRISVLNFFDPANKTFTFYSNNYDFLTNGILYDNGSKVMGSIIGISKNGIKTTFSVANQKNLLAYFLITLGCFFKKIDDTAGLRLTGIVFDDLKTNFSSISQKSLEDISKFNSNFDMLIEYSYRSVMYPFMIKNYPGTETRISNPPIFGWYF